MFNSNGQWADNINLQMEHKQIEECNKQNVRKTTINARLKKLIVQLTRLKKFIAWQL